MARVKNNLFIEGTGGAVGKNIVYRTIKNKTFACKYPDMSNIIPSKDQTKGRERFANAVAFARSVMKDPKKSALYAKRRGHSAYHTAIRDYMKRFNAKKPVEILLPTGVKAALKALSLSEPQLRAAVYINEHKRLTNGQYQKMNDVSKATATRHLQELAGLNIIQSNGAKGAGAHYLIGSWWKNNGLIGWK